MQLGARQRDTDCLCRGGPLDFGEVWGAAEGTNPTEMMQGDKKKGAGDGGGASCLLRPCTKLNASPGIPCTWCALPV